MKQWQELLYQVYTFGEHQSDRTGVGTVSFFGTKLTFDLLAGFPATTTKELKIGQVAAELAAFLKGASTKEQFNAEGCTIWDENIDAFSITGYAGRVYGVQWRDWRSVDRLGKQGKSIDQLQVLIDNLKSNPFSRRHLVTAWNPGELNDMCLPPCHCFFQCYVDECSQYLDLLVYMRSVDLFLGLPFDIASYAILQTLIAKEVNLVPRKLVFSMGDSHIYNNHFDQVLEVTARTPMPLPTLVLPEESTINSFKKDHVVLENYEHRGFIKAPLNV